jgi:hypothetical protein
LEAGKGLQEVVIVVGTEKGCNRRGKSLRTGKGLDNGKL